MLQLVSRLKSEIIGIKLFLLNIMPMALAPGNYWLLDLWYRFGGLFFMLYMYNSSHKTLNAKGDGLEIGTIILLQFGCCPSILVLAKLKNSFILSEFDSLRLRGNNLWK